METYDIWLGDREWEKTHGERLVGQIKAASKDEADRKLMDGSTWEWQAAHNSDPGYWLCKARHSVEYHKIVKHVRQFYGEGEVGAGDFVPDGNGMLEVIYFYFPSEQSKAFCYKDGKVQEYSRSG